MATLFNVTNGNNSENPKISYEKGAWFNGVLIFTFNQIYSVH